MKWPLVSRKYADFLESTVTRLQHERDEQQSRADRAMDALTSRFGYEPVSMSVRAEVAAVRDQVEQAASVLYEDAGSGMIAEEVLEMAAELGAPV